MKRECKPKVAHNAKICLALNAQDLEVAVSLAQHVCCGTSVHQDSPERPERPEPAETLHSTCVHACMHLSIYRLFEHSHVNMRLSTSAEFVVAGPAAQSQPRTSRTCKHVLLAASIFTSMPCFPCLSRLLPRGDLDRKVTTPKVEKRVRHDILRH